MDEVFYPIMDLLLLVVAFMAVLTVAFSVGAAFEEPGKISKKIYKILMRVFQCITLLALIAMFVLVLYHALTSQTWEIDTIKDAKLMAIAIVGGGAILWFPTFQKELENKMN